jgi:hypothetical protein
VNVLIVLESHLLTCATEHLFVFTFLIAVLQDSNGSHEGISDMYAFDR